MTATDWSRVQGLPLRHPIVLAAPQPSRVVGSGRWGPRLRVTRTRDHYR